MEYLVVFAQARLKERIGFEQCVEFLLALRLCNPQSTFGRLVEFMPKRAADRNDVLVFFQPFQMGRQILRAQLALVRKIIEPNCKQQDNSGDGVKFWPQYCAGRTALCGCTQLCIGLRKARHSVQACAPAKTRIVP